MPAHKLQRKSYPSLTTVVKEIEEAGKEKILDFNGYEIVTDRGRYGLCDGEVNFTKKR